MTVATIVIHTPIWVWPLYALLLFLGFQRTRDSNVALWRVLTLPFVVTLLAISTFIGAGLSALPFIRRAGHWVGNQTGAELRLSLRRCEEWRTV